MSTNNVAVSLQGVQGAGSNETVVAAMLVQGATNPAAVFQLQLVDAVNFLFGGTAVVGLADGMYDIEARSCTAVSSAAFLASTSPRTYRGPYDGALGPLLANGNWCVNINGGGNSGSNGALPITITVTDGSNGSAIGNVSLTGVGGGVQSTALSSAQGTAVLGLDAGTSLIVASKGGYLSSVGYVTYTAAASTPITLTSWTLPTPSSNTADVSVLCVSPSNAAQANVPVYFQVASSGTNGGLGIDGSWEQVLSGSNGLATMPMALSTPYNIRREDGDALQYISPSVVCSIALPVSLIGRIRRDDDER